MCDKFESIVNVPGKSRLLTLIAAGIISMGVIQSTNLAASPVSEPPEFKQDMLDAVTKLYGISEKQAIDRLARESEAAITFKKIQDLSIRSYGGSWFDASSLRLKVAIADPVDIGSLESFDVDLVFVDYSVEDLQKKLIEAVEVLGSKSTSGFSKVGSYIDYKSNNAVLVIDDLDFETVQSALRGPEFSELLKIEKAGNRPSLSFGPVRGANGTRNETWDDSECSVGASVEGGYATAGHCGDIGNVINDPVGDLLGTVEDSSYLFSWTEVLTSMDTGYVETAAGWTPSPQVNGYSDGIFSVSAEWGGIVEYPIGSTVCRYGQTSEGPHCGTVNQFDVEETFIAGEAGGVYYYQTTTGMTRVTGSCSDDGDSGGTWVAGTGQIQGTNIGVERVIYTDSCPTTAVWTYFQPIKDGLDFSGLTLLTTHGANPPTFTSVECPDIGDSSYGFFICRFDSVESQGEVTNLQWTSSNGGSSTKTWLKKRCIPPMSISVTLKATNPYGTTTNNYTFPCPQ